MPQKPKLGQNFLDDAQAVERIVVGVGDLAGRTVVEIGPGRGAITGALAARAGRVLAIEFDRELAAGLRGQFDAERVTVVEQDVLQFDFAAAAAEAGERLRVVGNLPYYITSPILLKLAASHAALDLAVLMVQREVADRVTAAPGSRDYRPALGDGADVRAGGAAVHAAALGIFAAAPGAFHGLSLAVCAALRGAGRRRGRFLRFLRQAFAQKRKTLANNLRAAGVAPAAAMAALAAAGIDAQARAEAVPIEALAALWRALE